MPIESLIMIQKYFLGAFLASVLFLVVTAVSRTLKLLAEWNRKAGEEIK